MSNESNVSIVNRHDMINRAVAAILSYEDRIIDNQCLKPKEVLVLKFDLANQILNLLNPDNPNPVSLEDQPPHNS